MTSNTVNVFSDRLALCTKIYPKYNCGNAAI